MTLQNLDYERSCYIASTEAQRIVEQAQLDAAKHSTERNRLGQFATPNALAIEILNYSKTLLPPNKKIRFLDPAIGTGSFYSALLQSFSLDRIESAIGYEIDRDFAETAIKLWADTPLQLNIADFTESIAPQNKKLRANLLICNPPYVRHHHLSVDKKKSLKQLGIESTGTQLSGLAGLYCYFLLAAHQWMSPDGLACWVIPAEFMDVNYGGKIKEYLLDRVTLLRVHRFSADDLQFANVLVSTSIIWFKNTQPIGDYSIEFTYGRSITKPISSHPVSTKTLRNSSLRNPQTRLYCHERTVGKIHCLHERQPRSL